MNIVFSLLFFLPEARKRAGKIRCSSWPQAGAPPVCKVIQIRTLNSVVVPRYATKACYQFAILYPLIDTRYIYL